MNRVLRSLIKTWQHLGFALKVRAVGFRGLLVIFQKKLKNRAGLIKTGFFSCQTGCQHFLRLHFKKFLLAGCLGFWGLFYLFNFSSPSVAVDLLSLLLVPATGNQLGHHLLPLTQTLAALGGLTATFFLAWAGLEYITSAGNPLRLNRAKQIFKNALLGLLLILLAATLVSVLKSSYQNNLDLDTALPSPSVELSQVGASDQQSSAGSAVSDFLYQVVLASLHPFLDLMSHLIQQTPLAGQNAVVVQLWWLVLGLVNSLFVLVVILLGFRLMSANALGFSELSFKQLLPKLIFYFVLINSSLFIVDALISLSNVLVQTLHHSLGLEQIFSHWHSFGGSLERGGLLSLLLLSIFVILSFCLLIYYILRWVVVYVGAVLSPLVILLYILPSTRSFCGAAMKTYFYTIYILFLHALILGLGFGLLSTLGQSPAARSSLLTLLIGIAVLLLMLKTPKTLGKWSRLGLGSSNLKGLSKDLGFVLQQSLEEMRGRYLSRNFKEDERNYF